MGTGERADEAGQRPAHLIVATFRRPHGVRGEFVVRSESTRPAAVFRPGRTLLVGTAEGEPTGRTLTLRRASPYKEGYRLAADEVHGRDQAEQLRGHTLLIAAEEAAPREGDELFHHELVGLAVITQGERIGAVHDVLELPGGEMLAVRRAGHRDLLIPFVREMVERVDLDAGELTVRLPEGMLDL